MQDKFLHKEVFLVTKISPKIFTFVLILLAFQMMAFSQVKDDSSLINQELIDEANIFTTGPTNCESLSAELDGFLYSAQKLDEDSKVIIVFRMHRKETLKHYNIRRKQLSNWFERRYSKRVVYTKGDVINDLGRADIYFNGKKVSVIKFRYGIMGVCSGDNVDWILR